MMTTLDFRREGVMHPAARIQELRDSGYNIVTHWSHDKDESGQSHRVAKYVLMNQKAA